jgi:hypothetical protein
LLAITPEETFGQLLRLGASYAVENRGVAKTDARFARMIKRHFEEILAM